LFEVLTKLLKFIVKIGIIVPSNDFKTKEGHDGIRCSAKANDGHLYPLKNSLIFIHKPVFYIKNKEIKYVEFSRVDMHRNNNWRSFDIEIARISSEGESSKISFVGIDKEEYGLIVQYLKTRNIKMKIFDNVTNQHLSMEEFMHGEVKEQARPSSNRRHASGQEAQALPDDYDSDEDDDSFDAEKGGEDGEDESQDESGEDDQDMDAVSESEMKELKKEAKKQEGMGKGQRKK